MQDKQLGWLGYKKELTQSTVSHKTFQIHRNSQYQYLGIALYISSVTQRNLGVTSLTVQQLGIHPLDSNHLLFALFA